MEAGVVAGVESPLGRAPIGLRLLGPLQVQRGGVPVALPPSRKARALIAYLALASHGPSRSQLCELLWDVPNDPRGELRWCLSKLRGVLDEPGRTRLITDGDVVRLDLADVAVDALAVQRVTQGGLAALDAGQLRALAASFGGDLLQGLDIERSASFTAWLIGQRRRMRASQVAILERLAQALPAGSDEAIAALEQWLQLAPLDRRAHILLLEALARGGRLREGEEHLATAGRLFEAEAQDWGALVHAWRAARAPASASASGVGMLPVPVSAPGPQPAARRASLAVMPFADRSRAPGERGGLGDGLAFDVITRLAKLRSVFVIAPGTSFALDARNVGAEEAGRTLNVDYVAGGSLRRDGDRVAVTMQLSETRSARIVWADVFEAPLDDAFAVLDEIGNRIVASLASQIEEAERNRAVLKAPGSLDAWEALHRGLWHMYRFDRADNEQARHFFESAVRLDPTFARPWAGLSFTHFQNAFLGWGEREHEVELAYRSAAQGLLADERDPSAHWAMGRALWLRGRLAESLAELDTAVELSPNFALGHYTLAFIHSQSGDAQAAIRSADHARELSPFDPLVFGMLATRALALLRLGRHDEAADWAVRAMARPNAHVHILAIGLHCLALAGRRDEALAVAASIQRRLPGYRLADLLGAFRFADDMAALMRQVSTRLGLG